MSDRLAAAISDLDEEQMGSLVKERIAAGDDPQAILESCRDGMNQVGRRYEAGEYFVSELIMAGEMFKTANALLSPYFTVGSGSYKGKIVFGTVKNDIHDIGKDLVVGMLKAAGYEVFDLGIDVPVEKIVETVKETGAKIVGLSGLLTIAFDSMKDTVDALKADGLRPGVKVMIGGGPVTQQVLEYCGADALGEDAQAAVKFANQWSAELEVA